MATKKAKATVSKKAKVVDVDEDLDDFLDTELEDLDSDKSEPDDDDLDDLEVDEVEEVVAEVVEKPKKAKKAKVVVTKDDETLPAEVLVEVDESDLEIVTDDYEFDPERSGNELREATSALRKCWIQTEKLVAPIIRAAKKHFRGEKEQYEKWLKKHANIGYSQAQLYLQFNDLGEAVADKAEELGLTSTHLKALPKLSKDPIEVEKFLDKKTHEVDGKRLKTAEMTPKEFDKAVKEYKAAKGEKSANAAPAAHIRMERTVRKVFNFLNLTSDEFKENLSLKGVDFSALGEDENIKGNLKTALKILEGLTKRFTAIQTKLG